MKNISKKVKGKLIKYTIFAIIVLIILAVIGSEQGFKGQYMNNLNYDVVLNEDGSMTVTETWDININHTNTIFKNFKLSSKFGEIKDVTVKDLKTGKHLEQIYEEMYHVTTDCFYAMNLSKYKYEIAWGTGMEKKTGNKKYQIQYTVTDVITDYKDCQEMYWMFLDTVNEVPVKNVSIKITLPSAVKNIENLKVWGHGPLNGNIKRTSNDTVEVSIDSLSAGRMLEVRLITLEDVFEVQNSNKIRNYRYLESALREEQDWADEANATSFFYNIFKVIIYIIYAIILINLIRRIYKYRKIDKQEDDGIIHTNLKYFRDIPREDDSTPGEATYLYKFKKGEYKNLEYQSNIVSATILNLCLKKYINLRLQGKSVYIKVLKDSKGLKNDELAIYRLIKNVQASKEEFNIQELNAYAKSHYTEYSNAINTLINSARNNLYNLKLVDKAQEKAYKKSKNAEALLKFLKGAIEFFFVGFIIANIGIFKYLAVKAFGIAFQSDFIYMCMNILPYAVLKIIELTILSRLQKKIAILTQKGVEEQEQWKGLANYMQDFSLLHEKDIPSIAIWEKYLVYATAFGIANKVVKQMQASYPEVFVNEYWEEHKEEFEKYQVIHFVTSSCTDIQYGKTAINNLNAVTASAYRASVREIQRRSSSSSGRRRRRWIFIRRRRPVVAEAGMGGR